MQLEIRSGKLTRFHPVNGDFGNLLICDDSPLCPLCLEESKAATGTVTVTFVNHASGEITVDCEPLTAAPAPQHP